MNRTEDPFDSQYYAKTDTIIICHFGLESQARYCETFAVHNRAIDRAYLHFFTIVYVLQNSRTCKNKKLQF